MHLNFLHLRPPWCYFPSPCFRSLSHTSSPSIVFYLFSSLSDTLLPLFHYSLPSCPMSPLHLLYIHFPLDYILSSHPPCIFVPSSSSIFLSCDWRQNLLGRDDKNLFIVWRISPLTFLKARKSSNLSAFPIHFCILIAVHPSSISGSFKILSCLKIYSILAETFPAYHGTLKPYTHANKLVLNCTVCSLCKPFLPTQHQKSFWFSIPQERKQWDLTPCSWMMI